MFTSDKDAIYRPSNLIIWFLLGIQGGILNMGGFMASHRFVSHITGYATLFGDKFSSFDKSNAFGLMLVPAFYFVGVMVSAWHIERRRIRHKKPMYTFIFCLMISILVFVVIAGALGFLGIFGEALLTRRDYLLLFLLVFVCGLQNAVISSASGYAIRTTHLTGTTTDVGIGVVRLWTLRADIQSNEIFVLLCRVGLIASFIVGSIIGGFLFKHFEFMGFLVPVLISSFAAFRLRNQEKLDSANLSD